MRSDKALASTQSRLNRWADRAGWISVATLLIGMVSLVAGFLGWAQVAPPPGVGPIASIAFDFAAALQSFVPNPDRFKEGNELTRLAAGIGMATTLSAGILTASALLAGAAKRFWIANFINEHVIVLGDTEFAQSISDRLAEKGMVVRAIKADGNSLDLDDDGPIPVRFDADTLFTRLRAAQAKTLILDLGNDTQTLNLAAALHSRLPAFNDKPNLAIRVQNNLLAEQFYDQWLIDDEAFGLRDRPALLNLSDLLARKTMGQHPLFAQADALGQTCVHAVILGFGGLGQAMLDQVFLTSVAGELDAPKVTILDSDSSSKCTFDAQRPYVSGSLGLEFVCFDTNVNGFDPDNGASRLCNIAAKTPVTAYFVALPSDELNLEAALQLKRLFKRRPGLAAPVFFRSRNDVALGLLGNVSRIENWPWNGSSSAPLCAIALDDNDIEEALQPDSLHDLLAQRLHADYVDNQGGKGEATTRWPKLRETYRRSNKRAASHLAAKLYTLGVDLNTIRSTPLGGLPALSVHDRRLVEAASPSSAAVLALARTEHTRWMIDRKLDGWRYGPIRDNANQLHPLLVEWDDLKKKYDEIEKDRRIVLGTLKSLLNISNLVN